MNNLFKKTTLALALAAVSGLALADTAETKGGLTIKTDDGRFEAKLGGRIHFDTYVFGEAETNGASVVNSTSTTEFRRARLTMTGKAYGWSYKFEEDFASSAAQTVDEREMWIGTKVGPGQLTLGQFKPLRSMEELTSSNEITMMERPNSSATGIYAGRQFQIGASYLVTGDNYTVGTSLFNLRNDSVVRNEGVGSATRVTFAPIAEDGQVIHIGASYSIEELHRTSAAASPVGGVSGRRGLTANLGSIAASESAKTIGLELAAVLGPVYLQAEGAQLTIDKFAAAAPDQDIDTYYVMASYHITGESKPYKKGGGVFGSVKPSSEAGAWEIAFRYDVAENKDLGTPVESTQMIAGLNWYVNPNVRFMFNYTMGEMEVGANKTEEDQYALRTQFSF